LAAAVRQAFKVHHSWDRCTRRVAAAFARNPASASERERWFHQLAHEALKATDIIESVDNDGRPEADASPHSNTDKIGHSDHRRG
jgi:hypothetical protein